MYGGFIFPEKPPQVTNGACQQGVEGVDTLQAAKPPCSVSNGPVKINWKTSVSGEIHSDKPVRWLFLLGVNMLKIL